MLTGQEYLLNHLTDTTFAYLIIFFKSGISKIKISHTGSCLPKIVDHNPLQHKQENDSTGVYHAKF